MIRVYRLGCLPAEIVEEEDNDRVQDTVVTVPHPPAWKKKVVADDWEVVVGDWEMING